VAKRHRVDRDTFLRFYNEGLNDHDIGVKLGVNHDVVYRLRRKLAKSGALTLERRARRPDDLNFDELSPEHKVAVASSLANAVNRVAALERTNRAQVEEIQQLHRRLGTFEEQYGALERRYEELNRRYQLLLLDKQTAKAD
jgi:phage shock protein A